MRIITVVMGEPDSKTRNSEVSSIFDYVYAQYGLNKIVDKETIIDTRSIERAKVENVDIVTMEDVNNLYKKSEGAGEVTYDLKIDTIKAPIQPGDVVGKLTLKNNNSVIKTIDLTVKDSVKKANIFELYYRYLKKIISMN